jgi:hypothetical protein
MSVPMRVSSGTSVLTEIKEFAGLPKATQRYIRRSLDIGHDRRDAVRRWSRNPAETSSIREQGRAYRRLDGIRNGLATVIGPVEGGDLIGPLVATSGFDLAQGKLPNFAAYRFLYERLLGAAARPWLPASAALPLIHPEQRRALLRSISEAVAMAPSWSSREPAFMPEWVEKVELIAAP